MLRGWANNAPHSERRDDGSPALAPRMTIGQIVVPPLEDCAEAMSHRDMPLPRSGSLVPLVQSQTSSSRSRSQYHYQLHASPSTSVAECSFATPSHGSPSPSAPSDLLRVLRARDHGTLQRGEQPPACDRCRKRKIKCDRRQPVCGTCIRLGTECSIQDVLKRRGPPTLAQKQLLSSYSVELHLSPSTGAQQHGLPGPLPVANLPQDAYVSYTASWSDPGLSHPTHQRPARSKRAALNSRLVGSKARKTTTVAEEAPLPPSSAPDRQDDIDVTVPETVQGREVITAGSVVAQLMEKHQIPMPEHGGQDQCTAAYISSLIRQNYDSQGSRPQVMSISRLGQPELIDFATSPRTMAAMCRLIPREDRQAYLSSARINAEDTSSVRAGACRLLGHPAAKQLHDFANRFHSRAPTFWAPDVEKTIDAIGKGHSPQVPIAWLGLCLAIVAIGTTNASPLPIGRQGPGQQQLASLTEFGFTCYSLACEIGDRSADFYDVGDASAPLAQLQVTSWLSTTSLFSEDPHRWHCYWTFKAWAICKQHGFHKVTRRRWNVPARDGVASRAFPTSSQMKIELLMRAVWGLVIVAALQSIMGNTNQSFLDEEVLCDYPLSLIRDDVPPNEHPVPQASDECFEAWSQYVHIQHLYVRMITGRLGQKSFWLDVSEVEAQLDKGGACQSADVEPAKRWLRAVGAVLQARLEVLDALCDEFEEIAADAYAFKAHNAQPKLPNGHTDLSGWLYVKNQSQRTLSISRRRLQEWEKELSDGLRLLEAMECPLPPSLSGTPSLSFGGDEEDEEDEYLVEYNDEGGSTDTQTIGAISIGALTAPETSMRRPRGLDIDPKRSTDHVPALAPAYLQRQPTISKLRSRLSRRSALEARVGDWLASVPDVPSPSQQGGGVGFKQFVTGDML